MWRPPHSHHYECMKLALCYGKPVLCEKAFTANAEQAEEILSISEEKKLFVGEPCGRGFFHQGR